MLAKIELFDLPLIGRIMKKNGHVAIDRKGSLDAMINSLREAGQRLKDGRSIVIFPTGTRGISTHQSVKTGVVLLYKLMKCPIIPINLNSGLFVFDRTLLIKPGVIQVNILPVIAPGLGNAELIDKLTKILSEEPA